MENQVRCIVFYNRNHSTVIVDTICEIRLLKRRRKNIRTNYTLLDISSLPWLGLCSCLLKLIISSRTRLQSNTKRTHFRCLKVLSLKMCAVLSALSIKRQRSFCDNEIQVRDPQPACCKLIGFNLSPVFKKSPNLILIAEYVVVVLFG